MSGAGLKLEAIVSVDGKQAAPELQKLVGNVADTKLALIDAKAAAKAAATELKALAKETGDTSARQAELKDVLRETTAAQISASRAASASAAELGKLRHANDEVTSSSGNTRIAQMELGHVIRATADSIAAGQDPVRAMAMELPRVAEAATYMGGALGGVGKFLGGPWGLALSAGIAILAPMTIGLLSNSDAADKAAKSLETFQKRQSDITNFIDAATGKLKEQNATLIRNAILTRQAQIDDNRTTVDEGSKQAFKTINRARIVAPDSEERLLGDRLGGIVSARFDPALQGAINAAHGDIIKLDDALAALGKRRPDLAPVIKSISDAAGASVNLARENKKLGDEIDILSGKTVAHGRITSSLVNKQEDLRVATTALEKARAKLALVETEGEAAAKSGGAALDAYRQHYDDAKRAVKGAEEAERAAHATRREGIKDTNAATRAAKEFADTLLRLDGISGSLNTHLALPSIAKMAEDLGKLNDAAAAAISDPFANRPKDRLTEISKQIDEQSQTDNEARHARLFGKDSATAFTDTALKNANAIGQAIGGPAGSIIATAAGLLRGARTGDYTGVGGQLGGVLTLASGVKGEAGSSAAKFAEGFDKVLGQPLKDIAAKFETFLGKGAGSFAKLAGEAAGGAAIGSTVGGIEKALGFRTSDFGAKVGGAIGGAIAGPLGAIVGGALGGLTAELTFRATGGTSTITNVYDPGKASGNSASQIKIAGGLGSQVQTSLESIAQTLGGTLGSFGAISIGKRNDNYRVDTSGASIGKYNGKDFGTGDAAAQAAVQYAVEIAIQRGGITGLSPRVRAVISRYGDDLNRAVAEAVKVKGIEDLLADHANPFATTFKTLETQLSQRIGVAKANGFDLVQIEKINGEERAKAIKDALQTATGSIKSLLNDFRFGTGATGSIASQLKAATTERDRLVGLVRGGDTGQLDGVSSIVKRIDDLQSQAYGATAPFSQGRADSTALLNDLVRQTEDRIKAAADAAKAATDDTSTKLGELNATADDSYKVLREISGTLAGIAGSSAGGISSLLGDYTRFLAK